MKKTKNRITQSIVFSLLLVVQCNSLWAQKNDSLRVSPIISEIKNDSNYINIIYLNSITDRHPEILRVENLRIAPPKDYWFKGHFGARIGSQIEYIRYNTNKVDNGIENNESQFDVYLNANGFIDSVLTINHHIDTVSQERIINLLKYCRWKPALSNLEPVNVNFILEIKFED